MRKLDSGRCMRYSHVSEHFPFRSLNGRIFFSIQFYKRKASEIVKHIRPFSGQLHNEELYQCLHGLILTLEELGEFDKLGKPETQFTSVPSTMSSSSRSSGQAKRWSSSFFFLYPRARRDYDGQPQNQNLQIFPIALIFVSWNVLLRVAKIGDDIKTVTRNFLIS